MPNRKQKTLTEREAVSKAAIVGTKDRETNEVRARHVENKDTVSLAGFVAEQAETGAKFHTDDAAVHNTLDPFCDHESVNHSVREHVRVQAYADGVESFWSMRKCGYQGTYHHFSPKHLQR